MFEWSPEEWRRFWPSALAEDGIRQGALLPGGHSWAVLPKSWTHPFCARCGQTLCPGAEHEPWSEVGPKPMPEFLGLSQGPVGNARRCVREPHRLCALHEFDVVWSPCALDDPLGMALYGYKRHGVQGAGGRVVTELLAPLASCIAELCSRLGTATVVLLPMSVDSYRSGRWHPNLLLFEGLCARLCRLREGPFSVWIGMHRGRSRSMRRRTELGQKRSGRWTVRADSRVYGSEEWLCDEVEWLGDHTSNRKSSEPRLRGRATIFVDDVLTTGYTAARVAAHVDPEASTSWALVTATRTVFRDI